MSTVLFIHHYNNYSGSTRVLANVINEEFSDSSDNMILTDMTNEGFLSKLSIRKSNVPIIRFRGRAIPGISQIIWSLVGFYKTFYYGRKYDIFYINTIVPVYAAIVGRLLNKRIIYHVHEALSSKSCSNRFAVYVFNHIKSERIFVSEYVKNYYKEQVGSISRVVYNKLSRDFVKKVMVKPIEEHHFNTVLMIGSLLEMKGVLLFRELATRMSNLQFILVVGADIKRINYFFKDDIPSNMHVYPSQVNIHPFLRDADLLLNLSIPSLCIESFGMTIIEGMAYGLPAIVPNVGGPVELIENGFNGYCTDPTNIDEVTRLILKSLEPGHYDKMRENALQRSQLYKY